MSFQRLLVSGGLAICLITNSSLAWSDEIIVLLDKTKITGKLVHFFEGNLTIKLPDGSQMNLPAHKVERIQLQLSKPRAEFSTPEKTFARLRQAAQKGDLTTYVDCHSTFYQMLLQQQINMATPGEFIKRLKQEGSAAKLTVSNVTVKGDTAVLKIKQQQAKDSQEGEMRLVRENNEWKMILPL